MVEMTETANILNSATRASLVLMDEVGRGTSTFDGLSLAWAAARHIAQRIGAFTLFATHYFELTSLPEELPACRNVHLDATEHGRELIFLHSVKPGPASQSYGLHVAELAGVPRDWDVVARIPRGRVSTYGDVAREAGLPGCARQAGYALKHTPDGMHLPWHRVVGAGGKIVFPPGSSAPASKRAAYEAKASKSRTAASRAPRSCSMSLCLGDDVQCPPLIVPGALQGAGTIAMRSPRNEPTQSLSPTSTSAVPAPNSGVSAGERRRGRQRARIDLHGFPVWPA